MSHAPLHLLSPEHLDSAGYAVTNPADGTLVVSIRRYNVAELTTIVDKAEAARHAWAARTG